MNWTDRLAVARRRLAIRRIRKQNPEVRLVVILDLCGLTVADIAG